MSGIFFWDAYLKRWNLRCLHPRGFQVLVFVDMNLWLHPRYFQVLEFVVEFLCAAVFYIVLHFLSGTEPLYPIQSTPTLSPTWFNFAFRLLTWVEFGLILLLQQLPLVREIHKALAISHFVVLFHKLLEICAKVTFFALLFPYLFLLSSTMWYMLCWNQGCCKNYIVYRIKTSVSGWSAYRHRDSRSMGMGKERWAVFSCLQTRDLFANFACCSFSVTI